VSLFYKVFIKLVFENLERFFVMKNFLTSNMSATFINDDVLSITSIPCPLLILLLNVKFSVFVADKSPQKLLCGEFGIIGELEVDADSGQRPAHEVSLRHAGRERIQLHAFDDVGQDIMIRSMPL